MLKRNKRTRILFLYHIWNCFQFEQNQTFLLFCWIPDISNFKSARLWIELLHFLQKQFFFYWKLFARTPIPTKEEPLFETFFNTKIVSAKSEGVLSKVGLIWNSKCLEFSKKAEKFDFVQIGSSFKCDIKIKSLFFCFFLAFLSLQTKSMFCSFLKFAKKYLIFFFKL